MFFELSVFKVTLGQQFRKRLEYGKLKQKNKKWSLKRPPASVSNMLSQISYPFSMGVKAQK